MIRLDRVELLHWDVQPHQVLPLAHGVSLVTGENGSGKTSILDALKVGLGAVRLEGDRTVDGYLAKQARPVAMIRILVDNRAEPGTRRRPFDALGEHSQDVVTLAVVFRAHEEDGYRREYYLLDGDVVPLAEAAGGRGRAGAPKPLPSATEYRERLKRVGLGPRYLKLLCLPQGQIASLCKRDGAQLFDDLYDIIGGRDALEAWEQRLRELAERQREYEGVDTDLAAARRDLVRLRDLARRHEQYRRTAERVLGVRGALPHTRLREARAVVDEAAAEAERLSGAIAHLDRDLAAAEARRAAARERLAALAAEEHALGEDEARLVEERDAIARDGAEARARLGTLEGLRRAADGVVPEDPEAIRTRLEAAREALARGQAEATHRRDEQQRLATELDRVLRGLLPLPRDVEAFRERLRTEGVPHHLLAEVIDVVAPEWRTALEGFLGRYRFAVLVPDAATWAQAAALARTARYPHGVLAPDVRGASPSDETSPLAFLEVKEARYRSLVARLLRRVRPGEPPEPLAPSAGAALLAEDGFLVSRIEAVHLPAERLYLGRDALRQREAELRDALAALAEADAAWRDEEAWLRERARREEAALEAQTRRLAWEAAREEHADLRVRAGALEDALAAADAARVELRTKLRLVVEETKVVLADEARAGQIASDTEGRRRDLVRQRDQAAGRRATAEDELGVLLAEPLPEVSGEVRAELERALPLRALQRLLESEERRLVDFTADERDELLPRNLARQEEEVGAVENRLGQLRVQLDGTRAAAEEARDQYQRTTRLVFRSYFGNLGEAGRALDFAIEGRLEPRENGRFLCDIRVGVGAKSAVHHDSEDLSGGQKAALSILMAMTAVSLESDSAGFFLIDEPFAASDVHKVNELGAFLARTGAQYLVSMPTSADLDQCGPWLQATWTCTRSRGGFDATGRPVLAPPVKLGFAPGARDGC